MTRMRIITRTLTAAALLAATSCSSTVRSGNSPMFLVIQTLQGIRGGPTAGTPSSVLFSDVLTFLTTGNDIVTGRQCTPTAPCGAVYSDLGQAVLQLAQKDVLSTTTPTTNNQVTISRIHVHYIFPPNVTPVADFDTFATATVPPSGTVAISFDLVKANAKDLPPLVSLDGGGQISATAEVTFFGTDQVGNAVSVTGSVQIEFSNWGD
jgi:hypothetical protein